MRRWGSGIVAVAALAAGVGTAVAVAGSAGSGQARITIEGFEQNALTISGSGFADEVTVRKGTGKTITINGTTWVNMRTDCGDGTGGPGTGEGPLYCNEHGETKLITAPLNAGDDVLTIIGRFTGMTIAGSGLGGSDTLGGSAAPESFSGGPGRDDLRGKGGADDLGGGGGRDSINGGPGGDTCRGGAGKDEIKSC